MFLDNALCFLTAGHVLKALDELRNHADVEITSVVLADTFGANIVSNLPIPFDLKSAKLFYIDDDDEGLDFGVIAIEPHYGRLLAKNGLVALSEENWKHQHRLNFERFALLGLPEEMTTGQLSPDNSGAATAAMVLLMPTTAAAGRRPTRHQQFVAKLESPLPKSPKGMSGGPIFGFRIDADNQLRYWIVALQSSWDPGSRTVYGTYLPVLAGLMTEWLSEASAALPT